MVQDSHMSTPRDLIHLAIMLNGWTGTNDQNLPKKISHEDAKAYASLHSEVRYEWWTEKTGPGTARVGWRLTLETKA